MQGGVRCEAGVEGWAEDLEVIFCWNGVGRAAGWALV